MSYLEKVMVGLIGFIIIALVALLIYSATDRISTDDLLGNATVIGRKHTDAYTTLVAAGKVLVPQYHSEKWELCLQRNGSSDSDYVQVSVEDYYRIKDGTQADISYYIGRWSKKLYISAVRIH